jgi:hypothetical protein
MKIFKLPYILLLLCSLEMFAQAPQKMSYQAIVRNSSNTILANQNVGIQISILQGSSSGSAVYVETQTSSTNANGLVSIEIGTGNVTSGNFSTINWANNTFYIKSEIDPTGGSNYSITGTSQLASVPYALYAANSGSSTPGPPGLDGTDGDSAYQIWLNAGNTGTQADFLNSLIGAQGPAGVNGNDGANGSNGADGTDGADGDSAYQIWLNAGNTGTQADFLNSLIGAQGVAGTAGAAGTDGDSAYQIWLNAGNTGTQADFLNSLIGAQGVQAPVIDNLTSTSTTDALSANQGKTLQDNKFDKSNVIDDDTFASATNSNVPSAESVKALVDNTVPAMIEHPSLDIRYIDIGDVRMQWGVLTVTGSTNLSIYAMGSVQASSLTATIMAASNDSNEYVSHANFISENLISFNVKRNGIATTATLRWFVIGPKP